MAEIYISHEDEDGDKITDYIAVYSDDYSEPLFGDYRGVELCRIKYIPSRQESVSRAYEIAMMVVCEEVRNGASYNADKGNSFSMSYKNTLNLAS